MKVKQIIIEDDETTGSLVVSMSIKEAAFIAKLCGKLSYDTANEAVPGFGIYSTEIYDCLTGEFFNRFYDDGVNEYIRKAIDEQK